ncbi:MAG: response regulator [Nitrospirae bacterium]|nr:response regulator [Nitrospirota bacterium]
MVVESKQTVLVVDDEKRIVQLLRETLTQAGFEVRESVDGRSALDQARQRPPDLMILDLKLGDLSGVEVCRQLRKEEATSRIPILMLTGSADEADKVAAFELGADDYVTKPFSPREIILRVRAILRRTSPDEAATLVQADGLAIDVGAHRATLDGASLTLTATEFRLLTFLVQHRGKVTSREELLDKVWGINADVFTRTVDMYITRLREKLGTYGDRIETVRGVGYRFSEQ